MSTTAIAITPSVVALWFDSKVSRCLGCVVGLDRRRYPRCKKVRVRPVRIQGVSVGGGDARSGRILAGVSEMS